MCKITFQSHPKNNCWIIESVMSVETKDAIPKLPYWYIFKPPYKNCMWVSSLFHATGGRSYPLIFSSMTRSLRGFTAFAATVKGISKIFGQLCDVSIQVADCVVGHWHCCLVEPTSSAATTTPPTTTPPTTTPSSTTTTTATTAWAFEKLLNAKILVDNNPLNSRFSKTMPSIDFLLMLLLFPSALTTTSTSTMTM